MRSHPVAPVILGAAILALAAAGRPATSEGYAYATYREISDRLTVLVDSYPAALHADDRYVPIVVAVGLGGSGPSVTVTPESFTLLDASGKQYPAASFDEIARDYPKRRFDDELLRIRPLVVGEQFNTSIRLPADFYPTQESSKIRMDRVELGPFTWFRTLLYFPRPEAGLHGVLTLTMAAEGIEPPLEVRFEVPEVLSDRTR
jgi:hypothetical protein